MARVWWRSRARSSAPSMISQWIFPCSGSIADQNHRQYAIDVSGKSGGAGAGRSFDVGPSSDHSRPALIGSPLKRWNVVMPMPGFTSASSISEGRMTAVSLPCSSCGAPAGTPLIANTRSSEILRSTAVLSRLGFERAKCKASPCVSGRERDITVSFAGAKARGARSCEVKTTMPDHQSQENVSRRKALKIIVGSASAAVSLPVLGETAPRNSAPACHAATHTQALAGAARAAKFLGEGQVKTLEALSETIIPADEHSPGAKAARVWEYIDAIIVDADESVKGLWTQGLAAVDKMAEREYQKAFADCAPVHSAVACGLLLF